MGEGDPPKALDQVNVMVRYWGSLVFHSPPLLTSLYKKSLSPFHNNKVSIQLELLLQQSTELRKSG